VTACVQSAAGIHSSGASIEYAIYPGARHSFNISAHQPGRVILGHRVDYNAGAAASAGRKMQEFLARHLD
jgi:dienelactone hydrolase